MRRWPNEDGTEFIVEAWSIIYQYRFVILHLNFSIQYINAHFWTCKITN